MLWLVNPDEEILDWKAVCGKTARTVWREGRLVAFSTPIVITTFKTYLQDASQVLCVMKKMREDFAITA